MRLRFDTRRILHLPDALALALIRAVIVVSGRALRTLIRRSRNVARELRGRSGRANGLGIDLLLC